MARGAADDATGHGATLPSRWSLPVLGGLAMRAYVAVWAALLVAAIAMPGAGLYLARQGPVEPDWARYAGTGFTRWSADLIADVGALLVPLTLVPAAALLFRQRRAPVSALLSFAFLIIAATSFHAGIATDAIGLVAVAPAVLSLGWAGFILALLAFPEGRLAPRWTAIVAALLPAHWIILQLDPLPEFIELLSWIALLAIAMAALTLRYRRLPASAERQQLRWVFFGFAVGAILFGTGVAMLAGEPLLLALDERWSVWIEVTAFPLAALGLAAFALGLIVALLRYRLYDAETVIERSAAYGVLTLGFVTLFACASKAIELIGERFFVQSIGTAAGVIGVGLAALIVAPLHNRVHRWAERRFKAGLVALRRELPQAMRYVRETGDVERLLDAALGRVDQAVRATRGAALVADPDGWRVAAARDVGEEEVTAWLSTAELGDDTQTVVRDRGDRLFPARLPLRPHEGEGLVGWLLLGPRPDGSFFGKDEQEALDEIAGSVARSLEIVRARRAREARAETRIGAIERGMAELAGRLDRLSRPPPEPKSPASA